jgi:hypothetical protein
MAKVTVMRAGVKPAEPYFDANALRMLREYVIQFPMGATVISSHAGISASVLKQERKRRRPLHLSPA